MKEYLDFLSTEKVSGTKKAIQAFWGDTCKDWYTEFDKTLNTEILNRHLDEMATLFRYRKHLAVTEMELDKLKGKDILEIGSGSGAHSALFKRAGANVTSLDITKERAISTARKLGLIKEGSGVSVLADAENLPFADNSFDIVYSNGVLHHTDNTEKCVAEIRRVLKHGGKAVIMLYCRSSMMYWLFLLPRAFISGVMFRLPEPEYLGWITEGRPKTGRRNPITKVYSRKELYSLFRNFKINSFRKSDFSFTDFFGGDRIRSLLVKISRQRPSKGGLIVYGQPVYPETRLEILLGRYFGFGWNIVASKR